MTMEETEMATTSGEIAEKTLEIVNEREEETIEEEEEERVEVNAEGGVPEEEGASEDNGAEEVRVVAKKRPLAGAATYRCTFKSEWTVKWPFITVGTTNSYYWCSVCRQENSCCHQSIADVQRHIKSKSYLFKEQALQSTSRIGQFYTPVGVGGMTAQESKVLSWSKSFSIMYDYEKILPYI